MRTKSSSAKSGAKSSGKSASASGSKSKKGGAGAKLASLAHLSKMKKAIFGSGKTKQQESATLPKNMKASSPDKSKTAQAKTRSKGQSQPKSGAPKKAQPVKATAVKASAKAATPVKAAKGAKAPASAPIPASKKAAAPKANGNGKAKPPISPLLAKSSLSASRAMVDDVCREVACEGLSTTAGYCRLHYIKNWKKIKRKEIILKEGKLNQYIEELVVKYPDKYIEAIRQDLASDKDFAKVISDLDLDESVDDFEGDGENVDALIDTIKRDFDDEGDAF
jgi:hypothetical protein